MNRRATLALALCLAAFGTKGETNKNFSIVAVLEQGPGNVTATPSGRVIMSQHQFYQPESSVVEWHEGAALAPFPNEALNDRLHRTGLTLDSVLGIRTDSDGVVWMLVTV
jgi:hypothetical protein